MVFVIVREHNSWSELYSTDVDLQGFSDIEQAEKKLIGEGYTCVDQENQEFQLTCAKNGEFAFIKQVSL